jgi:hypothetical protein
MLIRKILPWEKLGKGEGGCMHIISKFNIHICWGEYEQFSIQQNMLPVCIPKYSKQKKQDTIKNAYQHKFNTIN